jgi:hypothetical protein
MPVVDRAAAPASRNISIRGYGSRLKAGTTGMVRFQFSDSKDILRIPAARCAQVVRIHPASVTTAKRPSVGRDGDGYTSDLGQTRSGIFLQPGLDRFLPDGQISCGDKRSLPVIARSPCDEAIQLSSRGAKAGLLPPSLMELRRTGRGACHRARIRATRWLAMTGGTKIKAPPGIGRRFDLSV